MKIYVCARLHALSHNCVRAQEYGFIFHLLRYFLFSSAYIADVKAHLAETPADGQAESRYDMRLVNEVLQTRRRREPFDAYLARLKWIYYVNTDVHSCTCPFFMRRGYCKHVMSMLIARYVPSLTCPVLEVHFCSSQMFGLSFRTRIINRVMYISGLFTMPDSLMGELARELDKTARDSEREGLGLPSIIDISRKKRGHPSSSLPTGVALRPVQDGQRHIHYDMYPFSFTLKTPILFHPYTT